ncbi:alanine dehydrogenase [candidate division KSB1 bacterium]|nr:alanine dehydrogenase [candidate division KSB1 bacterium]
MNIGIPKEIYIEEKRISITPQGVHTLVDHGHSVFIETGAGGDCYFSDEDFKSVGGKIVYSHEEAFKRADLLLKVMPPTEEECDFLVSDQILLSFLQLGLCSRNIIQNVITKNVTTIGTQLIGDEQGHRPLLEAMGEIAGSMLPQIAGHFLECTHGGRGSTISGFPGIPPASVIIIGAGHVGMHAAIAFKALGANVVVLDVALEQLRRVDQYFRKQVLTAMSNSFNIERALKFADVVIGSAYEFGQKPPVLITRKQISMMKKGTLLIDVAIDQGGCFETSRPTTLSQPTFIKEGIVHYCVPNILASVARTASRAINNIITPYVLEIADAGLENALVHSPEIVNGVLTHSGFCNHEHIATIFNLPYKKIRDNKRG